MKEEINLDTILTEYYERGATWMCQAYELDDMPVMFFRNYLEHLVVNAPCGSDGCEGTAEVPVPSRSLLKPKNRSPEAFLDAFHDHVRGSRKLCPECQERASQVEQVARDEAQNKLRAERMRLEREREARCYKIRQEIKGDDSALFWYGYFMEKACLESKRNYEDKGYFERVILPIAEHVDPCIFAAIVSYSFYKANLIVSESSYPKSFSITVKSLLKRFLSAADTWQLSARYYPETLATDFISDHPELIDIDDIVLDSLTESHAQALIKSSDNVISLFRGR